jgi:hypothetical protein
MRMRSAVVAAVMSVALLGSVALPASAAAPAGDAPGVMTRAVAAGYYLDWVCWANTKTHAFNRAMDGLKPKDYLKPENKALLRSTAKVFRDSAAGLDAPPAAWPSTVAPHMSAITDTYRRYSAEFMRVVQATDVAGVNAAFDTFGSTSRKDAQIVRKALGLPPAGAYNAGCQGRGDKP